jgi:hypothetical protein
MAKITIYNERQTSQFTYTADDLIITGGLTKTTEDNRLTDFSGEIHKPDGSGDYLGNVSCHLQGEKYKMSINDVAEDMLEAVRCAASELLHEFSGNQEGGAE